MSSSVSFVACVHCSRSIAAKRNSFWKLLKCVKAWLFIIRRPPAKNWIWCNLFPYEMTCCSLLLGIKRNFTCLTTCEWFLVSRNIPRLMTSQCVFLEMGHVFTENSYNVFDAICLESLLRRLVKQQRLKIIVHDVFQYPVFDWRFALFKTVKKESPDLNLKLKGQSNEKAHGY